MSYPIKSAFLLALLLAPTLAHANVGVPMLALAWPAQWLALIPIIFVECEISRRQLQLPIRQLLWPISKANLISTLVGVPVAWLVMLAPLTMVGFAYSLLPADAEIPGFAQYLLFPLTAAWVGGGSPWEIYFAFLVLTVPFCLVSIFLEEGVLRKMLPEQDRSVIRAVTVRANIWSYVLLSFLAIIYPIML